MAPQEIRKFISRSPFTPFRLHGHDETTGLYRESVWIALNHVTRTEPITGRQQTLTER